MAFDNLPGIFGEKLDGNLAILPVNNNPIVLVIGTATKGNSETVFAVDKISDASSAYGKDGTLIRGMYEASIAGALNLRLFRIGATSAKLANVGGTGALTIETIEKDDDAGNAYSLFYDNPTKRLRVFRVLDGTLVYDNNPAYPLEAVDLNEVSVSGVAGSGASIGTLNAPLTLANADGVSGATYTPGTDGVASPSDASKGLSRMKMYEALFDAYQLLADQDVDVVLPMNVYLDDKNVMDMNAAGVTAAGLHALAAYPNEGSSKDVLGKLYTEEVNGLNYFWWWFPSDPSADPDATFTTDSGANIFPSVGSASATLKSDGTALTGSDFHEVNFAYQLADFCFRQSEDNAEMTGVCGVLPPESYSLRDVALWAGKLPITADDGAGNQVVTTNGTGLLGNKFMAGRKLTNGVPGYTVNGVAGLADGGFIGTDTGWLDDAELKDANDHLVDIGKYISINAAYPILSNPSRVNSYSASGAATYGGFYSGLPPSSAPTNKLLRNLRLPFRLSSSKLDQLAGKRYVTFHAKTKGIVVSDAPTAARPDSDYRRLSTVRIVKAAMDAVRQVGEPFLGEGISGAKLAALDTAIDKALAAMVKRGDLVRYEHAVTSTATQRVLGEADVQLKLVPAFELRKIVVTVALAAV